MEPGSIPGINPNKVVRRQLFENAMQGKWEAVADMYSRYPWLGKEKITKGGNTALHIAVSDRQERFVEQLVEVILLQSEIFEGVLEIKNKQGNTPLHLAASVGNVPMCKCIPLRRPDLVGVLNEEGETPLFLAACHGKMDAFFCLLRRETEEYVNTRNKKGETILHCSINGGHLKLAFLISKGFPNLIKTFNEEGTTPLHVLANKPGAFRSGAYLSPLDKLIYHCVLVQTSPSWFTALWNKICTTAASASTRNLKRGQHTDEAENILQRHMDLDVPEGPSRFMTEYLEARKDESSIWLKHSVGNDPYFPPNYDTCFSFIRLLNKAIRSILFFGMGLNYIHKIKKKKETNIWSVKIMDQLLQLQQDTIYGYDRDGWNPRYDQRTTLYSDTDSEENKPEQDWGTGLSSPEVLSDEDSNRALLLRPGKADLSPDPIKNDEMGRVVSTPILLAAKNGITEMLKKILEIYPIAIHDTDLEEKNVVLLAVENRHPRVYELLLKRNLLKDTVFGAVDSKGNSALHLAAMFSDNKPWHIPGVALQMQWEVMWYKFVKRSMPPNFFPSHNKEGETAKQIFTRHHEDMVQKGKEWLTNTATSCSVVATLIATVAFATATAVPGGTREGSGKPFLEQQPAFHIFAVSSLIALCFSVTSTVMFLAILTSRHQESDFGQGLPTKLLLGLTSLFISILSILVTFCAGHFFLLKDELNIAALPVYAVTCLPATFFALAQLPLYIDLIWATFSKVPQRWVEKAA